MADLSICHIGAAVSSPIPSEADVSLFLASAVLIGLTVAGFVLVTWVKKKIRQTDDGPAVGFSLAELRQLHRSGKLSDEEFERARSKMVEALKKAAEKPVKSSDASGFGPKKS
jgi:hypothetical protein